MGKNSIDNICLIEGPFGAWKWSCFFSRTGRKSEGVMGVSGGVWECGKPVGFSIISTAGARGERGR